jgi:hypothetical protein
MFCVFSNLFLAKALFLCADRNFNFQIRADVRHKMGQNQQLIFQLFRCIITNQEQRIATFLTEEEEGTNFICFIIIHILFPSILKSVLRFF